jgi:hypothetical protein
MTTKVVDFDFGGEKGGRKEGRRKSVELAVLSLSLYSASTQL